MVNHNDDEPAGMRLIDKSHGKLIAAMQAANGWTDDCEQIGRGFVRTAIGGGMSRKRVIQALMDCGLSKAGAEELIAAGLRMESTEEEYRANLLSPSVGAMGLFYSLGIFLFICKFAMTIDRLELLGYTRQAKQMRKWWTRGIVIQVAAAAIVAGVYYLNMSVDEWLMIVAAIVAGLLLSRIMDGWIRRARRR
jgi:hypothetical protein